MVEQALVYVAICASKPVNGPLNYSSVSPPEGAMRPTNRQPTSTICLPRVPSQDESQLSATCASIGSTDPFGRTKTSVQCATSPTANMTPGEQSKATAKHALRGWVGHKNEIPAVLRSRHCTEINPATSGSFPSANGATHCILTNGKRALRRRSSPGPSLASSVDVSVARSSSKTSASLEALDIS